MYNIMLGVKHESMMEIIMLGQQLSSLQQLQLQDMNLKVCNVFCPCKEMMEGVSSVGAF